MDQHDKIVVFQHFENAIDANLAKTKLDAHGIPCFLTEENMANLYASQSFMLFGVRLHVFSKDVSAAREILNEEVTNTEPNTCPRCQSPKIQTENSRKLSSRLSALLSGFLFFIGFPIYKVYRCEDCKFEF